MECRIIVVMGVSGAGKTTVGAQLAARLGWAFQDADDLHPRANVLKMAAGHALDDADRAPWLAVLHGWVRDRLAADQTGVLACSLLKRAYRDQVIAGDRRVALIYLHGGTALLRERMNHRAGHFMAPYMLDGQLEALEPPDAAEGAIQIDVGGALDETLNRVIEALSQAAG